MMGVCRDRIMVTGLWRWEHGSGSEQGDGREHGDGRVETGALEWEWEHVNGIMGNQFC